MRTAARGGASPQSRATQDAAFGTARRPGRAMGRLLAGSGIALDSLCDYSRRLAYCPR